MHKDKNGNIVDNESLAFGNPVTIGITEPHNILCLDETGNTTHGKDDGNKEGHKEMISAGETPQRLCTLNPHILQYFQSPT